MLFLSEIMIFSHKIVDEDSLIISIPQSYTRSKLPSFDSTPFIPVSRSVFLNLNDYGLVNMLSDQVDLPSAAVFGPQSKEPKADYLHLLRGYLCDKRELAPFVQVIRKLPDLWSSYSKHNPDLSPLSHCPQDLLSLSDWIETGTTSFISKSTSGVLCLPLLVIIQVAQYFRYLQESQIKHIDLILAVQNGAGIQGYCTGLLTAVAVACSADEIELVHHCCRALRLAVGVGAYSDLAIGGESDEFATIVVRLKYEEQAEEILRDFPRVSTLCSLEMCRLLTAR